MKKHRLTVLGNPGDGIRIPAEPPVAARVTGVLDTVSATSAEFVLRLPDGDRVRARPASHDVALDPETLKRLFNTRVILSGRAHFSPSGRLLFVAVEHIAPASPGDELWERLPMPRPGIATPVVEPLLPSLPSSQVGGVSAFFGIWPGDESDQELIDALGAIE